MSVICAECGKNIDDNIGYWWMQGDDILEFCSLKHLMNYRDDHHPFLVRP